MRTRSSSFKFLEKHFVAGSIGLALAMVIGTSPTRANAQSSTPAQTNTPMTVPTGQVEQPSSGGVNWQGVGYGVGTLAADVFYVPAKFLYAVSGGLVGGGAYVLTGGNTQTANTIWRSSLGGDYVVTPDMLAGKQPIHFAGPTDTAPLPPDSTVQPVSSGPTAPATGSPIASSQGTETTAIK